MAVCAPASRHGWRAPMRHALRTPVSHACLFYARRAQPSRSGGRRAHPSLSAVYVGPLLHGSGEPFGLRPAARTLRSLLNRPLLSLRVRVASGVHIGVAVGYYPSAPSWRDEHLRVCLRDIAALRFPTGRSYGFSAHSYGAVRSCARSRPGRGRRTARASRRALC